MIGFFEGFWFGFYILQAVVGAVLGIAACVGMIWIALVVINIAYIILKAVLRTLTWDEPIPEYER